MINKSVRETVLSGLFIALGLVLPMIFHSFGSGSTFFPMHIPVLIAGFVVSLPFSITIGIVTPILSSFVTGGIIQGIPGIIIQIVFIPVIIIALKRSNLIMKGNI